MRQVRLMVIVLICFLSLTAIADARDIPPHFETYVTDLAGVLTPDEINKLETSLEAYHDKTSNQIAILIIPSLEGDSIEEYSIRVAQQWGIGDDKKDNGILILQSTGDRKIRIEVGYGLEGTVTDAIASRIIRNEMAPHFKQDDYCGGYSAAIDSLQKAIGGEYHVDEPQGASIGWIIAVVILVIIIVIILVIILDGDVSGFFIALGDSGGGGGNNDIGGGGDFGGGGASGDY